MQYNHSGQEPSNYASLGGPGTFDDNHWIDSLGILVDIHEWYEIFSPFPIQNNCNLYSLDYVKVTKTLLAEVVTGLDSPNLIGNYLMTTSYLYVQEEEFRDGFTPLILL